jgi:hypothetical protein
VDTILETENMSFMKHAKERITSFAEAGFKGGLHHAKEHPACVEAQRERQEASNLALLKRIRELERKVS